MPSEDKDKGEESFRSLTEELRGFAAERDWEQFHTPRNLLLAMVGEVGELAEQMQWLSDEQLIDRMKEDPRPVEDEIADVAIYLFRLSDVLGVDLPQAMVRKIGANRNRYDTTQFQGLTEKAPHQRREDENKDDQVRKESSK